MNRKQALNRVSSNRSSAMAKCVQIPVVHTAPTDKTRTGNGRSRNNCVSVSRHFGFVINYCHDVTLSTFRLNTKRFGTPVAFAFLFSL